MECKGLNDNQVTIACGLSHGLLGQARTGKCDLGTKAIDKILIKYQDLSRVWLLTGTGDMLVDAQEKATEGTLDQKEDSLPLVPISAIGGALSETDGQWMEYDAERYIIPAFRKSDFLIRVEGDSMEPKYCRGDIVACKRVPLNDLWFQWGKVYVIDTRQGALIKYIQPCDNDEYITLVSENSHYKPFQLHRSELNGIAIVNGLIRVE